MSGSLVLLWHRGFQSGLSDSQNCYGKHCALWNIVKCLGLWTNVLHFTGFATFYSVIQILNIYFFCWKNRCITTNNWKLNLIKLLVRKKLLKIHHFDNSDDYTDVECANNLKKVSRVNALLLWRFKRPPLGKFKKSFLWLQ